MFERESITLIWSWSTVVTPHQGCPSEEHLIVQTLTFASTSIIKINKRRGPVCLDRTIFKLRKLSLHFSSFPKRREKDEKRSILYRIWKYLPGKFSNVQIVRIFDSLLLVLRYLEIFVKAKRIFKFSKFSIIFLQATGEGGKRSI